MTVTPTDIKTRYPEFSDVDDVRVQLFIDDAELEVSEPRWGDLYDKGVAALAAHFLALGNTTKAGTAGVTTAPVSAKSVGDVMVNYRLPSMISTEEDYYLATPYGQDYLRLMRIVGIGLVVVC